MKAAAEEMLVLFLSDERHAFPPHEREYRFHPERRWRFDVAFPAERLAVEIEGGAFTGGRHVRGAGFRADIEKYATATAMGWRVLRVLPEHVLGGEAIDWIEAALGRTEGVA